jgi:hypothetical protein
LSASNRWSKFHAIIVATIAPALSPGHVSAAEPVPSASYRSAFEGYRVYDAAFAQVNWRQANAAVAGTSHEAMHSTAPTEAPASGHEHMESRDVSPQNEADPPPATDPHAGHKE